MNTIWSWIGKIGKNVFRGIASLVVFMTLVSFAPDPVGRWGYNFWISVDQFVNTITLGDPDETISSRLGKWSTYPDSGVFRKTVGITACFFLDLVDKDHCEKNIDPEEGKDAVLK